MRSRVSLGAAVTLFVCGCGDPGQLGRAAVSASDVTTRVALTNVPVKGAEITVTRLDGTKLSGELLAATDDTMTLLDGSSIVRLGVADVRRAAVTRYDNGALIAGLTTWAVAGALGGISHGFLLIFSEPIWGGIASGAIIPVAADEGRFAYTERRWDFTFLHEYARFPQGLPPQYTGPSRARITP
jgi:hypothetical protein